MTEDEMNRKKRIALHRGQCAFCCHGRRKRFSERKALYPYLIP